MTKKEFINRVANGKRDFLQEFLDILKKGKIPHCVIGGLGVNAYAEPVVSLDLDIVVDVGRIDGLLSTLRKRCKVKRFANSINVSSAYSDLRIQIQLDPRYQGFIERATRRNVLGYNIPVARVEDVLEGKILAALAPERRPSKRQKDLADIMRLIEVNKKLKKLLPNSLKKRLQI
ncbi:MAG: hypothetical protein A2W05_04920 [Candidatus Schekmanbacteria bacterium RBG_16_38_10]|uniref:Uncharacterized protein n=1 Tax=Candidatus Schekmanbacteria bacterium RBG_16_38_10 TaxID=1817879 RepID=A0A1F7RQ66_9BACT|nr:MAG: hypothetical protein A2W05_04920 [Candidatus Schekmanbacteria bacterium RBG_16_38_10]